MIKLKDLITITGMNAKMTIKKTAKNRHHEIVCTIDEDYKVLTSEKIDKCIEEYGDYTC